MKKYILIFCLLCAVLGVKATPTIKLVSPYATPDSGWVVRGAVSFTVNVSSTLPITKVEFYIDNVLKSTDTTYPYSYLWNTRTFTTGAHTLKAIAYDSQSSATISQVVTVMAVLTLKTTTKAAVTAKLLPAMTALITDVSLRDVSICVGADKMYYMVGAMSDNNIWCRNEGVNLWRSNDLKTWTYVGLIWSFEGDATTADKTWNLFYNQQFRALWDTNIRYREGNYYLSFGNPVMGSRLVKSTSGLPQGPYAYVTPETNLLKTTIFSDTINKGNLYYDMLNTGWMFTYNGKQYLSTTNTNDTTKRYSSYVGIADSKTGDYGNWHEALPCGGNAVYFTDTQGSLWATLFGNDDAAPWRERAGIVKMSVDATGKLKVSTDQTLPTPTGVSSVNATNPEINIYPNPAQSVLNITNTENSEVSIFDLNGILMQKRSCKDEISRFDVSKLNSGVYLIRIEKDGQSSTNRFVVIH
ncbi:MAG: T9SS type A sorting domain-containing protein [Paludibacter sp.]